jgi:hypothetical protein
MLLPQPTITALLESSLWRETPLQQHLESFTRKANDAHAHQTPFLSDINPFNVSPEDISLLRAQEKGEKQTKTGPRSIIEI